MNATETFEQLAGKSFAPSTTNRKKVVGEVGVVDIETLGEVEDTAEGEDVFAVEEPIEIIICRNRVCTSQEISPVLSPLPNSGSGQNFAAKWRRDQTRTRRLNEIVKELVVTGLMLHHRT